MKHGTRFSIASGCVCDGCRLMARVYGSEDAKRPVKTGIRHATNSRQASQPLVDGTAWGAVIRELVAHGHTRFELAQICGVSPHVISDLAAGKRKVRQATVPKLRRMLALLPSEASA